MLVTAILLKVSVSHDDAQMHEIATTAAVIQQHSACTVKQRVIKIKCTLISNVYLLR